MSREADNARVSAASARAELAGLGLRADETLRSRRAVQRARAAFVAAAPWTPVAPASALVALAFGFVVPFWVVGACTLLPLVALVFVWSARVLAEPVEARRGLARIDAELGAHDALRTAHDFLGRAGRGAFEEAAIADAQPVLARARTHELSPQSQPTPVPRRAWALPLVALLLCLVMLWLAPREIALETAHERELALVTTHDVESPERKDEVSKPADAAAELARDAHERKSSEAASGSKPEERTAHEDRDRAPRESTGKSGEGRSADASPATNPSASQGVPSSQSQPSTSAEPTKTKSKPVKPKAPQDASSPPKKKPMQESGATAGRGVGSGSSKNPGATDWASKDQVSTDEEPPQTEDQDVDDESQESEARGGLQPNLRDRRPAVNRDLTIGFGNQPNPDANGRGGPSEQKKSRGVASLVLGVPIPDHVKGRPNPGRTKITQERVEPRADDAVAIEAASRGVRSAPIGAVPRRELTPWMRALVRGYFQTIRTEKPKQP